MSDQSTEARLRASELNDVATFLPSDKYPQSKQVIRRAIAFLRALAATPDKPSSSYENEIERLKQTNEALRRDLANPPPDIQEKVLQMLGIRPSASEEEIARKAGNWAATQYWEAGDQSDRTVEDASTRAATAAIQAARTAQSAAAVAIRESLRIYESLRLANGGTNDIAIAVVKPLKQFADNKKTGPIGAG